MNAWAAPKPDPDPRTPLLQEVLDCRAVTDPQGRLACFDKAVSRLDAAATKGDVVLVDRERIRTMKRQAFGLTLPSLSLLLGPGRSDDADQRIELVLASTQAGADGHLLFTFDDGSTWRQVDQSQFARSPKKGMKAIVSRGMMGSFFVSLDGAPGVRVQRQR